MSDIRTFQHANSCDFRYYFDLKLFIFQKFMRNFMNHWFIFVGREQRAQDALFDSDAAAFVRPPAPRHVSRQTDSRYFGIIIFSTLYSCPIDLIFQLCCICRITPNLRSKRSTSIERACTTRWSSIWLSSPRMSSFAKM